MNYDWNKARNNIDYCEESTGHSEIRLAFEVRLYFESDLRQHAVDLLRFYERAIETANTEFNFWFTPFSARYASDGLIHFRKSNKTMHSYLAKWIEQEKWEKDFAIELHTSPSDREVGDTSIQICNEPYRTGYLRLLLPVETFEKGVEAILEMVDYLVGDLDYISGYVGPGVNIFAPAYQKLTTFSNEIPKRLHKYRCVDFTAPYIFKDFEENGLLNIAWLTLLGKKRSQQSKLRIDNADDLSKNVNIRELGVGLCVQAEASPSSGEVGYDEIDGFRKICNLLGKAKLPGSKVDPFDSLGSTKLTVDWVDRFSN